MKKTRKLSSLDFYIILALTFLSSYLCLRFHQFSWIPPDEGHWAHVAERLNKGEVLYRDIRENHPSYIHFVHQFSFSFFGENLTSLRYPIIFITVLQSIFTYILCRELGRYCACLCAILILSTTFITVLNPTPNLYALFFTILIGCSFLFFKDEKKKFLSIGFCIGIIFLFRQLTAVYVAMGVLCALSIEKEEKSQSSMTRLFLLVAIAGLFFHSLTSINVEGFFLFSFSPILVLFYAFFNSTLSNKSFIKLILWGALGFFLASIPQLYYLIKNQIIWNWIDNVFLSAISEISGSSTLKERSVLNIFWISLSVLFSKTDFKTSLSSFSWLIMISLSLIVGISIIYNLCIKTLKRRNLSIPIIFLFFGLVPAFNQIFFYFFISSGLLCISLVWIGASKNKYYFSNFCSLILISSSLFIHAGQSPARGFVDVVTGNSEVLIESSFEKATLLVRPKLNQDYARLGEYVFNNSNEKDSILAIPHMPELYFLTSRRNVQSFISTRYALINKKYENQYLEQVMNDLPKLIVHCPNTYPNKAKLKPVFEKIIKRYSFEKKITGNVLGDCNVFKRDDGFTVGF